MKMNVIVLIRVYIAVMNHHDQTEAGGGRG